jgi:hypothetical protein
MSNIVSKKKYAKRQQSASKYLAGSNKNFLKIHTKNVSKRNEKNGNNFGIGMNFRFYKSKYTVTDIEESKKN